VGPNVAIWTHVRTYVSKAERRGSLKDGGREAVLFMEKVTETLARLQQKAREHEART